MAIRVSIKNLNPRYEISTKETKRVVKSVLKKKKATGAVSIVFLPDRGITSLNRRYRNRARPTDVLSFSMREGKPVRGDRELLGDIAISLDTARRQAARFGEDLQREVARYLIHGLLHLLGSDDETPRKAGAMKKEEDSLLESFRKINLIKANGKTKSR